MTAPRLLAIGTALPDERISQARFAELAAAMCALNPRRERTFNRLYNRSRIDTRHSVLLQGDGNGAQPTQSFFLPSEGEHDRGPTTARRMDQYEAQALPLARRAAENAIRVAGITPQHIGHSITASCTGFHAPGVDVLLPQALGLSPDVGRTHVGFMGCHGSFNALRVAGAMVHQLPREAPCVLVTAVELCSLHFAYGFDAQKIVANALFADGAAAAVIAPSDFTPPDRSPPPCRWHLAAHGTTILPDTADAMTWHIHDHGFVMTLSPRVPEFIMKHLRPWLTSWLNGLGLAPGDTASWAVHPGGPRILESVEESLSLPSDALRASHQVLAECGNMSSPTILFICERLMRAGAPLPCVAIGFGPGLTVEAMAFTG